MRSKRWLVLTFVIIIALHNVFDIAKFAIGRFTDIGILLSIVIMLVFSLVFTLVMEIIHRWRSARERRYVHYEHHGVEVFVRGDHKGLHWEPAICMDCEFFKPDSPENCPITHAAFEMCKEHHIVLVVWECPTFKQRKGRATVEQPPRLS